VKEKRKGPIGRAAGLAGGVAATVRRLQREREPHLLVYDETGYARLVQPDARGYESLLETAEKMVALVSQAEAEAKPRLVRRTEKADEGGRESEDGGARKKPRPGQAKKPRAPRTAGAGGAKKPRASRTARTGDAKKPRATRSGGAKRPRRSAPKDGT
jgi:hypothetical protein